MLLNKIDENEEEQGFIKAKQQISIDYKCMSYSLPKKFQRDSFTKKLRSIKLKIQSIENIKYCPFINQSIREQTYNQFVKKQRQNIIFNNFNNEIGQPQPNITFDANFPMGNLEVVTRVRSCHYEIYMRPDTNTNTHFQWFYFRVRILKKKRIKFTIKNFIKATMLYSKGLKPFYMSKKQNNGSFQQISQQVTFSQDLEMDFFNLTFTFDFKHDNDEVQFASQPPYGYEMLQKTLNQVKNAKRFVIGKTILGNKIPYLVFNQRVDPKVIGIAIARQHPGEAVGSWMMDGFIQQLAKGNFSKQIQWIVVPMINIDGVELGNNRTGVLGHDFNRNWNIDQTSKKQKMFPQISSVLNYIRKIKRKYPKKLKIFLDLHGHSSEQNVFTYGPQHIQKSDFYYMSRLFPEMIAKRNENFKLDQSSYKINNDKKNAARSIILNQIKIPFTYTIECTFGVMNNKSVTQKEIIKVGQDIALSANQFIENFYVKDDRNSTHSTLIQQIKEKYEDKKHQAEEYESASEASQDTPDRKQFQMNIQSLLQQNLTSKRTSLVKLSHAEQNIFKSDLNKCKRKNSEESLSFKNKQILSEEVTKSIKHTQSSKRRSSRVATQGCNPQIYNQCAYFPPVKNRSNWRKTPILQKFTTLARQTPQIPEMMNMKEIQQRLFKLRNSRIGKKILVINAYGV